ncbi:unnamed protein product [Lepeophtheirus salmonis]|uniref:(salmon louse) hypothetical protein n=1 Tax=Lepeophtheirus salmonis TaxID=72036 RepID=A0A7R8CH46_LEPSM|nr:unnamed protein product [Lepeophtheirus salmonis]CAF2776569.1 unnamed protein product [Lepeophtheirus salmonis]
MNEELDPGSVDDSSGRKRRRRTGGITLGGGHFAERTLMNLGRKITKYGDSELSEWEKCVRLRDPNTSCVRVARPRDSRMAVSRTPGGGVKKVYPAIIVSQIFRSRKSCFITTFAPFENVPIKPQ